MNPNQIYCVTGNDEFRVSAEIKRILAGLLPPEQMEHALETIDARASNTKDALEAIRKTLSAAQEMGLFSSEKVIHLCDCNFLNDSRVGKVKAVKERVGDLAALIKNGLAKETVLLISTPKIDKRYALYKSIKGSAVFSEFSLPDKEYQIGQHIEARLAEAAKLYGVKFSGTAKQAFVSRVDADTRTIYSEVAKVHDYVGHGNEVTDADVAAITSHSRDRVAWDFADAVCRRDAAGAISLLRQLIFQGEEPMALVIGLENRFRDLLVMRSAMDQGWAIVSTSGRGSLKWSGAKGSEESLSAMGALDPRGRHPFQQLQLGLQAMNFRAGHLDRILKAVVETHQSFMQSGLPAASLLESLVLRIMVRTAPKKK